MGWIIACFCGNLLDTATCPHCGSTLPDLSVAARRRTDLTVSSGPRLTDPQLDRLTRSEAA
jgi:hypothetical protein